MTWREIVEAWIAHLKKDTQLTALLGGAHIYRAKSRASIRTPGIYYSVVSNRVDENTAPVVIQWDIWTEGAKQAADIELRLFQLMHSDLPIEVEDLRMWSQLNDAFDSDMDDEGIVRRIVEYQYRPARLNG